MYSIRSITNLFALNSASAGSLVLFDQDGEVLQVPGQDPYNPLFIINATTRTVTVNGIFSNPSPAPSPLALGDGAVSTPSLTFASDSTTGLFRPAVNQLGLVAGGANPVVIRANDVAFSDKRLVNVGSEIVGGVANQIAIVNSNAATASLNVRTQLIVGIVNAVDKLYVRPNYVETTVPIHVPDGSNAAPSYTFTNDPTTGILRGPGSISISTSGASRLNIANATTNIFNALSTNIVIPSVDITNTAILNNSSTTLIQGDLLIIQAASIQILSITKPTIGIVSTFAAGLPQSLAVYGRYLYAGDSSVDVYDLKDPSNVVLAGSVVDAFGLITGLCAQGNRLYTVSQAARLNIYDITKPTPVLRGGIATTSASRNVFVKSDIAFVMGDTTASSYNVANEAALTMLHSIALGGAGAANMSGNYIYVADTGTGVTRNISIVNTSNPYALAIDGFLDLRNVDIANAFLSSIVVSGRYAYVGLKFAAAVYIIDVSVPTTPTYFGKITTANAVKGMAMEGNYLYVTIVNAVYKYFLGGTTMDNLFVGSILADTLHVKTQTLMENNLTVLGGAYLNTLDVKGSLGVSGMRFPIKDGTAGQYIRTDGAGNLSFQSGIAGVSSLIQSAGALSSITCNDIGASLISVVGGIDMNGGGITRLGDVVSNLPYFQMSCGLSLLQLASVPDGTIGGDTFLTTTDNLTQTMVLLNAAPALIRLIREDVPRVTVNADLTLSDTAGRDRLTVKDYGVLLKGSIVGTGVESRINLDSDIFFSRDDGAGATEVFYASDQGTQLFSTDGQTRLYLANATEPGGKGVFVNPLIGGYRLPLIAGSSGQVITANGSGQSTWETLSTGIYSQTSSNTVANTIVETTIYGPGSGSWVFPANYFQTGTAIMYQTGGIINTDAIGAQLQIRLKDSGLLLDSGLWTLPSIPTAIPWSLKLIFSYKGGNAVVGSIEFSYGLSAGANTFIAQSGSPTFNPLISNTLNLTLQWAATSVDNSIRSDHGVLTRIY